MAFSFRQQWHFLFSSHGIFFSAAMAFSFQHQQQQWHFLLSSSSSNGILFLAAEVRFHVQLERLEVLGSHRGEEQRKVPLVAK